MALGIDIWICQNRINIVCVKYNFVNSDFKYFEKIHFDIYNNDEEVGCYESKPSASKSDILWIIVKIFDKFTFIKCNNFRCFGDNKCKSFFYNDVRKQCMFAMYSSSSLPRTWSKLNDMWEGYNVMRQ